MKQLILRREARADALEAYRWYEDQREGLGAEFREELRSTLQRVRQNPQAYAVLSRDTRRARLTRFPYSVFFREYPEAVAVVAIMHARRSPRAWRLR